MALLTHYKIDPALWTHCKLFYFLFYFGKHNSSTLLVLMSLEKCSAVYFPLKAKIVCTIRTAKWVTCVAAIVLASCDCVSFLSFKPFITPSGRHICIFNDINLYIVLRAIDSVLYSFRPFTIMLITNFAIAFKFMTAKCNQNNSSESTNQALAKSATRGTAMVVSVSVTFLLLTVPSSVGIPQASGIQLGSNPLYRAFVNLTQYLNHSINGVLYNLWIEIQKELLKIFSRKERPEGLSRSHSFKNISLNTISESRN